MGITPWRHRNPADLRRRSRPTPGVWIFDPIERIRQGFGFDVWCALDLPKHELFERCAKVWLHQAYGFGCSGIKRVTLALTKVWSFEGWWFRANRRPLYILVRSHYMWYNIFGGTTLLLKWDRVMVCSKPSPPELQKLRKYRDDHFNLSVVFEGHVLTGVFLVVQNKGIGATMVHRYE